ncbi:aminotransferase class V-fold PLP-dependent enzyme [Sphingomonas sp.]|uniref:aminotransferase class V-fold PLP-dependent enzyme n=1 Tax=Sphingomonas sp. TaxID=28214 RepID=UPI002DD6993B|nr:aminotransferase class V-fold PLP-dependent enzyme [Sphingomonas sp.]
MTSLTRRAALFGAAGAGAMAAAPPIRLDAVREDFPIVANGRAFLNSAYIAPVSRQVADAAAGFMRAKAEAPMTLGMLLGTTERVRKQFAALIGADADEVGLLFSTAEAENLIASGLELRPGDNVVIDDLHYDTEFILYRELERTRGIELRVAKNRSGRVGVAEFAPLVDRRTRLLSVAWVSHRNGFRHDLAALAELAHAHGALLYADAIQGIGALAIDVKKERIDFLCAGSYKWLFAGWGVAPFYCRRDRLDRLRLDRFGEMHASARADGSFAIDGTARRFDYSSRAFGEVHALGAALDHIGALGVPQIEAQCTGLAMRLRDGVERLGLQPLTPPGNRSPIVSLVAPRPIEAVRTAFDRAGVDVTARQGMIRIAPAVFNTETDIDRALDVLKGLR